MSKSVYILILLSIFVMRNILNYESNYTEINGLTDGRVGESTTTTQNSFCRLFRSDLSACAQNSKYITMRNSLQGRNATGSIITQINLPQIALDAANVTTTIGFFIQYFNYLPHFKSNEDAFTAVNVEYYLLHKQFKYASLKEFYLVMYKNTGRYES